MFWRLPRKDFDTGRGEGNRKSMARLVRRGGEPGILAFAGDEPVGWCAVAPRDDYPALARSRVLAAVDDTPVWSVSCFFVKRGWRRKGLTVRLLREASRFAAARGAKVVEGYPMDPNAGSMADAFAWTGLASAFRAAGFREVARRSPTRPIFRKRVRAARRGE
jgi:GNAT superfamily N-acetyltransferase